MSYLKKDLFELCERAITHYEQRELNIPYGCAMGTLRHNEIEFDNNLLSTKAGKFSPSKVNILIGQVSLKIWLVAMIFHVGYLFSEILVRNCDGYNKLVRIESVYMISLFLFLFLLGLIYYLYRFFKQKGIEIESSYLSMNNEEKYIKDFNTIKALVFKESRGNCWFFIKSVFRSLCLLENKNKKTISTQKQFILESLQEIYNISSERANQLEELAELTLSFPLTNKEEKYFENS